MCKAFGDCSQHKKEKTPIRLRKRWCPRCSIMIYYIGRKKEKMCRACIKTKEPDNIIELKDHYLHCKSNRCRFCKSYEKYYNAEDTSNVQNASEGKHD